MIYHGNEANNLSDLNVYARRTTERLRPHKGRFDSLAVTGMSGVILGSVVSLRLNRPLVVLRKESEQSHAYTPLINWQNAGYRFLFLDDFISLGNTYHRVRAAMHAEGVTYAGAYLYGDDKLSWDGDGQIQYHPERAGMATFSGPVASTRKAIRDETAPVPPEVTLASYPATDNLIKALRQLRAAALCRGECSRVIASRS